MKAAEWIDRAKAMHGWTSDYRAAKEIGIKPNTISMYRTRGGTLDEETALKVAQSLGLPPAGIIIDQAAERSKNPEVRAALAAEASKLFVYYVKFCARAARKLLTAGPVLAPL